MRLLVALGPFDSVAEELAGAVRTAGGKLRRVDSVAALGAAARAERPDLVLAHADAPGLEELGDAIAAPELDSAPVVGVLPHFSLEAAVHAAALGADDCITVGELAARLTDLLGVSPSPATPRSPARRRKVLLADAAPGHRRLLAFLLERAGFDVVCAADGTEALLLLEEERGLDLLVLDFGLPGCEPTSFLALAEERLGGPPPPGIGMLPAAAEPEAAAAALTGGFRHLHCTTRPPDELVFLANESTVRDHARMRAAPRFPCAALVRFRPDAGGWRSALSHNISMSGLYVRTLLPPEPGQLLDSSSSRCRARPRLPPARGSPGASRSPAAPTAAHRRAWG